MATLLLRLRGPMQSWGTSSRWDERDTQPMPTKSGVLGLVCSAIGRDRAEPVDDLARLRMGVLVLRPGTLQRDYQTVNGALSLAGDPIGKPPRSEVTSRTVVSQRYYLADADFVVGLETADGETPELLTLIYAGLQSPKWFIALGRKGYTPSCPVWVPGGVLEMPLREALVSFVAVAPTDKGGLKSNPGSTFSHQIQAPVAVLQLATESASGEHTLLDQPIAPYAQRHFGPRRFHLEDIRVPA